MTLVEVKVIIFVLTILVILFKFWRTGFLKNI